MRSRTGADRLALRKTSREQPKVRSLSSAAERRLTNSGGRGDAEEMGEEGRAAPLPGHRAPRAARRRVRGARRSGNALARDRGSEQQLQDRAVRDGAAVRGARWSRARGRSVPSRSAQEFVEQARLADPRLAGQQDDRPLARRPRAGSAARAPQLAVAPDQRGQPALLRDLEPGAALHLARERVGADRLALSLHLEVAEILEDEHPIAEVLRPPADDDLARLGDVEEPGGEVGGVAHRGVVHAQVSSDRADHHGTGVDPDAHAELDPVHALDVSGSGLSPSWIASAALSARGAWSSWAIGAPKSAITPSPRNWLIVPSQRWTAARITSKTRSMMPWTSSGSRRSDIAVKPDTSENITVTVFRSPSRAPLRGEDLLGQVFRRVGDGGGVPERGARGRRRRRRSRRAGRPPSPAAPARAPAAPPRVGAEVRGQQAGATLAAELLGRLVRMPAAGAGQAQACAALTAELVLRLVLCLTRRTQHYRDSLDEAGTGCITSTTPCISHGDAAVHPTRPAAGRARSSAPTPSVG